jgi:two-component system cell cycle response regulator DivK
MARILVAEDDAANMKLAVTVLEGAGHEVLQAQDGAAAVALASAHLPDLVLLDIQMPGMDGFMALHRLREDARTARLKVAAFTALAMKGDAERLLAEGFDGYLAKPIRYRTFLREVARFIEGEMRGG